MSNDAYKSLESNHSSLTNHSKVSVKTRDVGISFL